MGRRPVQGEDGEARKGGGGEGEAAVKDNKKSERQSPPGEVGINLWHVSNYLRFCKRLLGLEVHSHQSITRSPPNHHHIITRSSPDHRQIIAKSSSSPDHHHQIFKSPHLKASPPIQSKLSRSEFGHHQRSSQDRRSMRSKVKDIYATDLQITITRSKI